jgi:3-(3-hydroxy-phenyl)propionate hydroxylase
MCQGVRDAANLGWKLASVLRGDVRGSAANRLLDSYGAERKAHVRELTSRIKAVGAVICERDADKARARDARLLAECGGVVKNTPRQDILPRLECGLLSSRDHPARGSLFPQPWLQGTGRRERMDAAFGNGWRLVLAPGTPMSAQARVFPGLRVVALGEGNAVEMDGVAAAWFGRHSCAAALVRPDNYVFGCASAPADVDTLLDELAAALGVAPVCAT